MTARPAVPLFFVVALLGAPAARAAAPEKTAALVEKGKASFSRNCVACHGQGGEGDGPAAKALKPKPRNLVAEPTPGGVPAIFEVLSKGKKGTGMIAYKHLSEEERWALAYYVEGLAVGAAKK
jgi:high-affinity iron transporter